MSKIETITPEAYVEFTRTTAQYPGAGEGPTDRVRAYLLFGLIGEIGEVAQIYKRQIRDGTAIEVDEMALELGDVLWYWARMVDEGIAEMPPDQAFLYVEYRYVSDAIESVLNSVTHPLGFGAREVYPPSLIATCGYSPEVVAARNVEKLSRRLEAGTIKGKGAL